MTYEELFEAFPTIYKHDGLFDFSVPDGWLPLLWDLSEKLAPYSIQAIQVKEKFGTLRFYIGTHDDDGTDIVDKLIEHAERETHHICHTCGKKGKRVSDRIVRILCDDHITINAVMNS